jgi:predicted NAD/FAD-binding protein
MRIAVVGGGISGLAAAWLLAGEHAVTLYEKDGVLGGHAHTQTVELAGRPVPVDTAFIVLNRRGYPNLVAFLELLGVPLDPVRMVLAVSLDGGAVEWSTRMPGGLFADRANLVRPSFWRLLRDIHRFGRVGARELDRPDPAETLGAFLDRHGFDQRFRARYLYPLTGAVWSTPAGGVGASAAHSVLRFLDNHGVLRVPARRRSRWCTVRGGSIEYVMAVARELADRGADVRTGTPVRRVRRDADGVRVRTDATDERYDHVVLATHADTALSLLDEPTAGERRLLGRFAYTRNEVYLHGDPAFRPRRPRAAGTWVYTGEATAADGSAAPTISYDMNALRGIDPRHPVLVTLNPATPPEPSTVYGRFRYEHPVFSPAAVAAQAELDSLQGERRTLFCGSYFGYGFHEDGLVSAVRAVGHLGVRAPWRA